MPYEPEGAPEHMIERICVLITASRQEIGMKFVRTTGVSLFLLLALAIPGMSQEAFGKFTVTHETRWGTGMLPAGTYQVALHSGPVPYVLVSSESGSGPSLMAVSRYAQSADCKTSSLELEQSEAGWNVRSLCFASQIAVYFGGSHAPETASMKNSPQVASLAGVQ